jgi:hypothetical protein
MVLNRKATHAMAVQVNRVNLDNLDALREENARLLAEVHRLRELLKQAQITAPDAISRGYVETPAGKTYNGRPVIMLEEATLKTGVNYWTIYRYVTTGTWQGVQLPDRRWLVYTDQPLNRPSRTKR